VLSTEDYHYDGHIIKLTVSVGACKFDNDISQLELIKRADVALYMAKNTGRDKVVIEGC
jgi:GGDEF domain-containing protein